MLLISLLVACGGSPADTMDTTNGDDTDTVEPADVCGDGASAYTDLQQAIDDAADGDEITVCAGHWGPVAWAGKAVSLRGVDGAEQTFLEGDADHAGLTVTSAPGGTISGVTLTGDGAATRIAASIDHSTLTLTGVRVAGISVSDNTVNRYGVYVNGGAVTLDHTEWSDDYGVSYLLYLDEGTHTLVQSSFHDVHGTPYLIDVTDSSTVTMTNDVVYDNDDAGNGFALAFETNATGRVANVTFVGNAFQADADVAPGVEFVDNLSYGARGTYGFDLRSTEARYNLAWSTSCPYALNQQSTGEGNLSADPLLVDAEGGDFHLQAGSPAVDGGDPAAANDADGSRVDIGAYGGPDPYDR